MAIVLAAIFIFDLTPWVRGGFGWRWEYRPVPYPVIGFVIVLAIYVLLAWRMLATGASARMILLLAFVASVAVPVMAVSLREGDALRTLFARTLSIVASAHQWGAAQIDWSGGEWREWTSVMGRLGSHLSTSPPGQPVLYALVTEGIERFGVATPLARPLVAALCTDYRLYDLTTAQIASGWLGILSPVWAALTVFPMYSLAKRLGARADQAVLLWPIVPAISAFTPSSSTVFPLLAVLMFLPLAGALSRRAIATSGLLFGIATFVNFAMLPLAAMFGVFVFIRWLLAEPRPPVVRLILDFMLFAVSGLIPWAIWFLFTGQTPLQVLEQALGTHLALARPYSFWVWFHIWDWGNWSGIAISAAAVVAGVRLWGVRRADPVRAAFPLTLGLTLILLTISGMTRGESGRIWLFLTPFLLIVATSVSIRWSLVAVTQIILTVALIYAVDAYNAPDVPDRPQLAAHSSGTPLAVFTSFDGGEFALMSASVDAEGVLQLEFAGRIPTIEPVWFGVIAVDAQDDFSATGPQQPYWNGERLPSTCWTADVSAPVRLQLPPLDSLSGNEFYVSLSAYGFDASEPAMTVVADGEIDRQVGLGPFTRGD